MSKRLTPWSGMCVSDREARANVHFVCISAWERVNGRSRHSSICLNVLVRVPCVFPWVLAVPCGRRMRATRGHVLNDTPACHCFMCRLCPKEAIDQDQHEGRSVGVSGRGVCGLACWLGGVLSVHWPPLSGWRPLFQNLHPKKHGGMLASSGMGDGVRNGDAQTKAWEAEWLRREIGSKGQCSLKMCLFCCGGEPELLIPSSCFYLYLLSQVSQYLCFSKQSQQILSVN